MLSLGTRRGEIRKHSTPLTHNRQLKSKKQKRLAKRGSGPPAFVTSRLHFFTAHANFRGHVMLMLLFNWTVNGEVANFEHYNSTNENLRIKRHE